ncbi:glycosyltransferase family 4 protein [Flavobacterium sedimenticola]|uniref:Glycosyltransferase family 4 protein n=1 Tax=Flavobacterium sedimenticola TaxID=3043286 RepID=A0ABT6XRS4_9FLAO|nr:glycosyltransferase family 4 protein [Flavobacterium sedimenticola]MDI9257700.1 glycosyltransferase family 4 protein [Flavobacterium sedimenticola]
MQVALSFINECRKFPEHEYHVWVGPGVAKSLVPEAFPANFSFSFFDFGIIHFKKVKTIQRTLAPLEAKIQPDIIIATSGPSYFHSVAPQIIGFNLPLYIYPESPFVKELSWKAKIKLRLKKMVHYYYFKRDATAYVVQTDDVNVRVRKALHTSNVHTVTNTFNNYFLSTKTFPNRLPEKEEGEIRLLTLTSYYSHKNLELIPMVAKELEKNGFSQVRFVLTLAAHDFKQHIEAHPGIINVGPIKPEECPSLYRECDVLFLPTLAECFSASYAEAMITEKPIITTDLGFARSICGEAALYFEAKNPKSAAKTIQHLLAHRSLWKQLTDNGKKELEKFDSAEVRAKKYIDLCQQYATLSKHNS